MKKEIGSIFPLSDICLENKGKSLITPLGTLDRLEILRNVPERVR